MRMIIVLLLSVMVVLPGCASMQKLEEKLGSNTDAYVECAKADVLTTTIGLASGSMLEANPLVNALKIKALGSVFGTVAPVIGLSIAGYYILKWLDKPPVTAAVTVATCFAAARNLGITITH